VLKLMVSGPVIWRSTTALTNDGPVLISVTKARVTTSSPAEKISARRLYIFQRLPAIPVDSFYFQNENIKLTLTQCQIEIIKELSGYLSLQAKRFRVICKIRDNDQTVEIHYVGHRKDIYELFREAIAKHCGCVAG
jgi:mRNA-degrading endonuclease RelE of RelBE toxin-antitoxin system